MDKEKEYYDKFVLASISQAKTSDLIAELERRRPCGRCARNGNQKCFGCKWNSIFNAYARDDNFKEITK